ncbi:hypothetical protein [Streptococcus saliviloxodontae]|uniref:Phage protein n=1 Tax=Streptococcus saliviloxodontae TaxID=1349416 RepID=A0ABS2PKH6_9STRE|nr:hypothetical protein [Streptococcus saliviloxodontae]MBM7635581.1 hypothetical protein [Streptococcus saliviloxodontae]
MIQELNLPIWQTLALYPLAIALIIYLCTFKGAYKPYNEPYNDFKEECDEIHVDEAKARYGAYVQSQGRYYN